MTLLKTHNKAEHFALGHYLSEWPENWSYEDVVDELEHGNEERKVWMTEFYQDYWPETIAIEIKELKKDMLKLIGS
jgi:hypothetical protein